MISHLTIHRPISKEIFKLWYDVREFTFDYFMTDYKAVLSKSGYGLKEKIKRRIAPEKYLV